MGRSTVQREKEKTADVRSGGHRRGPGEKTGRQAAALMLPGGCAQHYRATAAES